jgi:hypothetical protein
MTFLFLFSIHVLIYLISFVAGRFAVACGTVRNVDGVKKCLGTNQNILYAIQKIERLPSHVYKKMETVKHSITKLQRMLYEISLSEATGRNMQTTITIENEVVNDYD